jgi:hypothetical protein
MAKPSWDKRLGVTPIRAVLVGVLTVVLVIVLVSQFSGSDGAKVSHKSNADPPSKNSRTGPRSVKPVRNAASRSAPVVQQTERAVAAKPWSRMSAEEACQFNPLKMPSALAANSTPKIPPEVEMKPDDPRQQREEQLLQQRAAMQSLQEAGVGLVVASDRVTYAIIGAQVVHVGDVIQGFVVKEIGPQGVVLADQHAK